METPDSNWKERYWARIDKNGSTPEHCPELGPCWIWTGKKRDGYGRFYCGKGRYKNANRIAYFLGTGQWPDPELFICHHCDNPPCCNPAHLFEGTNGENIRDASAKGRMSHPKPGSAGENHYKSWITWNEVDEIRKEVAEGIMQKDVAVKHGLHKMTVSCIVNFKTWKPANRPLPAASTIPAVTPVRSQ